MEPPDASAPRVAVLLVDDDPANLVAMTAALEGVDAKVVTARSGTEALGCLLREEFAAILMDVQMPVLDGFETAALIRQRPRARETPILFITAVNRADEHVARGYALGAVDYVLKPVPAETLRSKVSVFVELARKQAVIARQAEELRRSNAALRATAEELRRAKDATERANRELETFNSAVAHDLRAPLRSISGFSRVLLEDYSHVLDDEGKRLLQRVISSGTWMGQLIDDLLNLSQCTRAQMREEEVDLGALATNCLAELAMLSPERRVDFRVAPELTARGDPRLLRAALENLLRNAWKFTSKHPTATIEVGRDPETDAFFVRDDGAGFDMAYASKLFNAFQRLHRQDEFEGNGIGLITVKRIVERHGGRVWGTALPGKGATFCFTLGESGEGDPIEG